MPDDRDLLIIGLVILWTLPWKGVAMWRAARRGERAWFIAFLVIHTLAIIEIAYIFLISRRPPEQKAHEDRA